MRKFALYLLFGIAVFIAWVLTIAIALSLKLHPLSILSVAIVLGFIATTIVLLTTDR
jgi:uncharacterized membrane protein HdeD (DUF308 family)